MCFLVVHRLFSEIKLDFLILNGPVYMLQPPENGKIYIEHIVKLLTTALPTRQDLCDVIQNLAIRDVNKIIE